MLRVDSWTSHADLTSVTPFTREVCALCRLTKVTFVTPFTWEVCVLCRLSVDSLWEMKVDSRTQNTELTFVTPFTWEVYALCRLFVDSPLEMKVDSRTPHAELVALSSYTPGTSSWRSQSVLLSVYCRALPLMDIVSHVGFSCFEDFTSL